jgi:hypothetical protein
MLSIGGTMERDNISVGIALAFVLIAGLGVSGLGVRAAAAQPADQTTIVGVWEGTLDPGGQPKKRVVVHVAISQEGILGGTVDFPDQDVSEIPMTAITFKNGLLHFETSAGLYDGTMNKTNSELAGTWKPMGSPLSLNLKRTQ